MSWAWYGAKTLYETTISSQENKKSVGPRLIEERITLIHARTDNEALQKAELEAQAYASASPFRNSDGDLVETAYMGACDIFSINDDLKQGTEVYSSLRVVTPRHASNEILDMLMGPEEIDEEELRLRAVFEPSMPK